MSIKRLLCPARVRRVPVQFSWIDQRLVRDHWIGACSADGLALYLFLVTVADAQGLSYFGDQSLVRRLACLDQARLVRARLELQQLGFIAYERPVYQVLSLSIPGTTPTPIPVSKASSQTVKRAPKRALQPVQIGAMLRRALEGIHD